MVGVNICPRFAQINDYDDQRVTMQSNQLLLSGNLYFHKNVFCSSPKARLYSRIIRESILKLCPKAHPKFEFIGDATTFHLTLPDFKDAFFQEKPIHDIFSLQIAIAQRLVRHCGSVSLSYPRALTSHVFLIYSVRLYEKLNIDRRCPGFSGFALYPDS